MAIISDDVYERTRTKGARVFFVSRSVTKWWNARRRDPATEIALLGGWYWSLGGEEAGPFRSPSAAWRDVYYRRVVRHQPPMADAQDVAVAEREIASQTAQSKRRSRNKRRGPNVVELRRVA